MVPSIRHFENLTLDPTSPWFMPLRLKSHEWTFAKLRTTVHDNIFEVLIAGSLSSLYSWLPTALFYLHRGASHIGSCWGGRPLACHFGNASVEMTKFVRSDPKTMFHWPVDPDRVISNHRDSSHVGSCHLTVCWLDFANSTSADHFDFNRLHPTTVNRVWCLQCGQIF